MLRKSLELAPERVTTRGLLALTLLAGGQAEEALTEAASEPNESFRLWATAIVLHVLGRGEESDEALRRLTLNYARVCAFQIAETHAMRGETDAAFEWLERAYAVRDGGLTVVKTSSRLRSLHGDPRWGRLLKKMDLSE
jgi:hypothetical protein